MISRSIITFLSTISFVLTFQAQANLPQKEAQSKTSEERFLERFVGTWIGEGLSDGNKTRDEMKFEWMFGKRFLKLNYRTLKGKDNYTSEGFLWFNDEKKQYEYYEFNNGRWAVRQGIGKTAGNSLMITERREKVNLQLNFEFVNQDTIKITEVYFRKKGNEPFVIYTFQRKSE